MRLPVRFWSAEVNGLLLCFLVGFAVRLVPELLAFPNPVGFDTVDYAAFMKDGVVWPHWSSFFTSSWLFLALSVSVFNVLSVEPFMLLKVLAPVLFGLNVAGMFWFARRMLGWSVGFGLLAGLFFSVQLASLRISWDLFRNLLGLGILLFTLPFVRGLDARKGFVCFSLGSLLVVFAHEYAAVTLAVVVLGLIFWSVLKGEDLAESRRLFFGFLPAFLVFLVGLYLRFFPVRYQAWSNVVGAGDAVLANVGGLFFLTDYLSVRTSVDAYASYFDLVLSVGALFCLLYLSYVFLVWKGYFRNRVLGLWTVLLLVGAFGCLVVPFCALLYWHRWMFMLVYPFTFYAVNGLKTRWGGCAARLRCLDKKALGIVCATFVLGGVYLATPVLMSTVNVGLFSLDSVNRYFSFAPTVPYEDVDSVKAAMAWLNGDLGVGDCLLVQHAFLSWGKLYLDRSHVLIHFDKDVGLAVDKAYALGFSRVFFVWWNVPIGWYGVDVPADFVRLKDFGRISVYEHV